MALRVERMEEVAEEENRRVHHTPSDGDLQEKKETRGILKEESSAPIDATTQRHYIAKQQNPERTTVTCYRDAARKVGK